MKIVVGSTNPVKVDVVREGFSALFPDQEVTVVGCAARSGISDQPMTPGETLKGANKRAYNARKLVPDADYWVGIEGGIEDEGDQMYEFAWVYVLARDIRSSKSRSTNFLIPPGIAKKIRNGMEHGPASDEFFKVENSKQTNGTIGIISNNVLTRTSYQLHAVICAFIPFLHPELYPSS